jgi:galactose mutarotase-like enzyme
MARYQLRDTGDALEPITLHDLDADASVTLAPARGGMATRFSVAGEPVLYLDEATLRDPTKSVRGGVPLLLPIAGRLDGDAWTHDGAHYPMRQHGFGRNLPWAMTEARADGEGATVLLRLDDDTSTRAQYPFGFTFEARWTLAEATLTLTLSATCREGGPMPVHVGTHPYLHVAHATKSAARVDTDATRGWDNVARRAVTLAGLPDFGAGEVDLHLLDHSAQSTVLHRPGATDLQLMWSDNLTTLVLWTLPERDFVCVEPWASPAGAFARGDAPRVATGTTATWWWSIGRAG